MALARSSGRYLIVIFVFLAGQRAWGEEQHHAEYHPNMVAVFVGMTGEGRRENGLALGLEYARRLNEKFSIGGLAEYTFGDLEFLVVAVPFAYHVNTWKLYVAPGVEEVFDDGNALVRVGVEYGIEVGNYEIAPQIDYDFVSGENALVVGITIGRGF